MKNALWRGAADPVATTLVESDLGLIFIGATETGVCALSLGDDADADALTAWFAEGFPQARRVDRSDWLQPAAAIARAWVETPQDAPPAPALDIRGAPFMRRVWAALQAIPCGETRTYSEIADAVGSPKAARAAASGCANNLISLFIPCHRVVRRGGGLGGYAWGLHRKETLLERERGDLSGSAPVQISMALDR